MIDGPAAPFSSPPLQWTARDLARLVRADYATAPRIAVQDVRRVDDKLDVWDAWPLADKAGNPVPWRGGELWFALAAPAYDNPEERHALARIHHFHRTPDGFVHLGRTFPPRFTPGSREWSGTAMLRDGIVTLYFTSTGHRGEDILTFRQRLFCSSTRLIEDDADNSGSDEDRVFEEWSAPSELTFPRNIHYLVNHEAPGRAGQIKAFRDPAAHIMPDGREVLLFTASSARNPGFYNGVIGCAVRGADGPFRKLPPLVDASSVNNELERPHIVEHRDRLYLFWSTQASVFAPGIDAPTGLYGATASSLAGPWTLLNGHGLVFANPPEAPFQAYSWWVLPDLSVASFVDYWGGTAGACQPDLRHKPRCRCHFGGTFAPFLRLHLEGERAILAG